MKKIKGWLGEKKTGLHLWISIDPSVYKRFHNVIIPSSNGTAQIDHLIISQYGLFVIETKNKDGWIFGSENQSKWTSSLYGKNYTFQNPLKQTYRQKMVLSEFLKIDKDVIHTVIYFVGDCKFKTQMPENVINKNISRYIKGYTKKILTDSDFIKISSKIENHINKSYFSTHEHIRSIKERRSSTTICPNCGAKLVERVAKTGPMAGKKFLGCSRFPKCRFTRHV